MTTDAVRIGELSRRTGVSVESLRAWERRYGLLRPSRTAGGFRLYTLEDEERVRRMLANMERGQSAREAARAADEGAATSTSEGGKISDLSFRLRAALDDLDEPAAQAVLDDLFAAFSLDAALTEVLIPYLRDLGARWQAGEVTVATEHFASNLVRGRLLGLARGWGRGTGSLAMLAGPPGERHDIGLIMFGLLLRQHGWRISFLGADTPIDDLATAARSQDPAIVVLAASERSRLRSRADDIRALAAITPVALAGSGASITIAEETGATYLEDDPVRAAEIVAAG
jgi:DNA-binding transcriptional MerR regulator